MSLRIFETAHGQWTFQFFETDKTSGEPGRILEKVEVFEALSQGKTWFCPGYFSEFPTAERGIWKMY